MKRFLPPLNSWRYYLLLLVFALFIFGPIGAVMGAFMLFSLGFSVGVQVLAGILGSAVTFGYGAEGKHGANYMQTAAASVASIGSLAVLIQAQTWLGLPPFDTYTLMAYVCSIGMFGIGVGMFCTPLVVDRMQLTFPSGLAVANILRALTDPALIKQSIAKLASGTGLGLVLGIASNKLGSLSVLGLSVSTIGAGMLVGVRIAVPGLVLAIIGEEALPWLRKAELVGAEEPFRKIGFVVGLGMILGASIVDIIRIMSQAISTFKRTTSLQPTNDWKTTNKIRLALWVIGWGGAVFFIGTQYLALPIAPLLLAMGLVFVFLLINGISTGISDSNPVSAAFVIGVFLMGTIGLQDIRVGLLCATVLLVSCSVGVDMQQDRSTGWRLGTNRTIQFRYQVVGILLGSVLCVVLAQFFLAAYPILQVNQFGVPKLEGAEKWNSAFTYKLVGILKGLTNPNPNFITALEFGILVGLVTELLRKLLKDWRRYQTFIKSGKFGFGVDFAIDTFALPSPYAASFGGFVDMMTALWFALGGIMASFAKLVQAESQANQVKDDDSTAGTEEMSTVSLVGGGLIAGDSLCALILGIYALASALIAQ